MAERSVITEAVEVVRAAETEAAVAATAARPTTIPDGLVFGVSFEAGNGLEMTVLGMRTIEDEEPSDEPPRHVVVRARIANAGEETAEFENNFGVLDPAGNAHRYRWVNPAKYAEVLPGIATLEPGAVIEGDAHVMLPDGQRTAVELLRPSVLRMSMDACTACEKELHVAADAVWERESTE